MTNIIYPPLVEDACKFTRKQGFNLSKAELYKKLIEANFIDKQGNATQWAIDQGFVEGGLANVTNNNSDRSHGNS